MIGLFHTGRLQHYIFFFKRKKKRKHPSPLPLSVHIEEVKKKPTRLLNKRNLWFIMQPIFKIYA